MLGLLWWGMEQELSGIKINNIMDSTTLDKGDPTETHVVLAISPRQVCLAVVPPHFLLRKSKELSRVVEPRPAVANW